MKTEINSKKSVGGGNMKYDGAYLDAVFFCQDLPERVLKLGEIHLMASAQQSLWGKSHF